MDGFHDRWSHADVRDRDDKPIILNDGDIEGARRAVLTVLAEYRLLDAPHLAAITGYHPRHIYEVIKELKSRSNHYIQLINPQRERRRLFSINATLFYELSPRGIKFLQAQDIPIQNRYEVRYVEHRVMEEHIMAEFEIAARKYPHINLRKRAEILTDPRSGSLTKPESVRLSEKRSFRFDGRAFVLERKEPFLRFFFPGIEAETGTHTLASKNNPSDSVRGKFSDNLEMFKANIHADRYNAKNSLRIPYFVALNGRLPGMIEDWRRMTSRLPEHRHRLLFKYHPTYLSKDKPRPTAHMFEEPFLYVDTGGEIKELRLLD